MFSIDLEHKVKDFLACFTIKGPSWLIGPNKSWSCKESTGNSKTLTLPSTHLGRSMESPRGYSHLFDTRPSTCSGFFGRMMVDEKGKFDIFQPIENGQ